MPEFIVALQAIEITAGENDVIALDEAGVVASATVAPGTYWMRGDGSADCILTAAETALAAAFVGGNAYALDVITAGGVPSWNRDPANASAIVRVQRSAGSANFRVRWLHASTTFDVSMLGFAAEKGAANANDEVSTLSPAACWVHNDRHIDLVPDMESPRAEVEMGNGGLEAVTRGDASHKRRLMLELVDGRRMWPHRITADPSRSYGRFWRSVIDGRRVELHETDLQAGSSTLLSALSTTTRVTSDGVTHWLIAGESAERVGATRVRSGMDHWDLAVLFHGYVTP